MRSWVLPVSTAPWSGDLWRGHRNHIRSTPQPMPQGEEPPDVFCFTKARRPRHRGFLFHLFHCVDFRSKQIEDENLDQGLSRVSSPQEASVISVSSLESEDVCRICNPPPSVFLKKYFSFEFRSCCPLQLFTHMCAQECLHPQA